MTRVHLEEDPDDATSDLVRTTAGPLDATVLLGRTLRLYRRRGRE
jgi:hypothetical protein